MNIELKSEVLQNSILIEDYLSRILTKLFLIRKTETITLGHRGTALSFKAKTDLLYDLGKIEKPLYTDLLTFMEIRNQFIHNGDTNSFIFVIKQRINNKKTFTDYVKSLNLGIENTEKEYQAGFHRYTASIITRLNETDEKIWSDRMNQLGKELELHNKIKELEQSEILIECLSDSIDEVTSIFGKRFKETFKDPKDIGEKLKIDIQRVFDKKLKDKMSEKNER